MKNTQDYTAGEIHGIYKQMQTTREHEGKVYIVCDCQGIVKMLQNKEKKVKLRKRIKKHTGIT